MLAATPLAGLPEVRPGDDLAALIASSAEDVREHDVLVVAQKVVSKSEGRLVRLDAVTPGEEAQALAARTGKDPRLVQLILAESTALLRVGREVLIVRTREGLVC